MLALLALLSSAPAADRVTILHTNDWQSRMLGFGPNAEYTPDTTGDDDTIGGMARMGTLIEQRRAAAEGPVLLVDGGDWTMGSLFHTVTRENGTELQLMARMGYDAVTVGNHEFDFRPDGLARMIRSAQRGQGTPTILATNLNWDPADARDDDLERLQSEGTIRRSLLLDRGGVKVGLIGIMGVDAYEVIGQIEPVTMADPTASAREQAIALREQGANLVLLLSHSGIVAPVTPHDSWTGEEIDFARDIPEIDAVIGGHSHTPLEQPIVIGGTPVVQAGSDGRYLGELVLERAGEDWTVASYTLHPVDDSIPGDPEITAFLSEVAADVDARILAPAGYRFDQPLAETSSDLTRAFDDHVIGNLVTDAYREATGADIAFTGNGTLRADIDQGRTGVQRTSDLFRISGLGIGTLDATPGYAMQVTHFRASDLKAIFEFLLIGYQLKGRKYYPRISGAQVLYNDNRVPFDRVMEIRVGNDQDGYRTVDLDSDELYSAATTTYIGSFLPTVKVTSKGLLDATPRNAAGEVEHDMQKLLVDADPNTPGVQELKAWRVVLDKLANLPDTDGDGLADLPTSGPTAEPRFLQRNSWAPRSLLQNSTWKQKGAVFTPIALMLGLMGGLGLWIRRRRGRSQA